MTNLFSPKPRHPKRNFTVAEANRAIVLVRRIVADVIFEYSRMLDLQEAFEAAEEARDTRRAEQTRLDLIRSAGRLRTCLEELDDVRVELRDWSLGVVDFPCLAGGRQVSLCWQYGHDAIEYWHEADAGMVSRRPIDTLPADEAYAGRGGVLPPARPGR